MVKLAGDHSVMNRSIVVHAGKLFITLRTRIVCVTLDMDDLGLGGDDSSLSNGNAGARVGCCIITEIPEPTEPSV